ncbi:uncharacterized protein LOC132803266 [Ziziphus jujuba]|uniref:Uncharacterized protein LOC132803266 n=1 Tax=Ziziphus jujuba TaxID=326968 RepID=A0ABM4A533_ZIZJJ|nr:uncharacterized protein LOC132803266 [Ziziphus jujuba]
MNRNFKFMLERGGNRLSIWRKPTEHMEHTTQIRQGQKLEPVPLASEICTGMDPSNHEVTSPIVDNSDLPIARKSVPNSIQEALRIPAWKPTVAEELRALESNGTWTLSKLPHRKKPVGCKWILRLSTRQMGELRVNQDWPLHQLDVKNTFLNGNLEEKVYVEVPPALENSSDSRMMTPGHGLFKKCENREIEIYTDASWIGELTDKRYTTGYCICEGMWLQRLLSELEAITEYTTRMLLDSRAAIIIAKTPIHHDRAKHIEIDRHFISEKVNNEIVQLTYIPTSLHSAEIFTKALPRTSFEEFRSELGLYNIYNPA